MRILVSACLLGEAVRYDGSARLAAGILQLKAGHELFAFCPEVAGGLAVPREPAELRGSAGEILRGTSGGVYTVTGRDVTAEFRRGAQKTLQFCLDHGIQAAILKERSPSCGVRWIYDGSHSGKIQSGMGLTAALLQEAGIPLYSEETFHELLGTGEPVV